MSFVVVNDMLLAESSLVNHGLVPYWFTMIGRSSFFGALLLSIHYTLTPAFGAETAAQIHAMLSIFEEPTVSLVEGPDGSLYGGAGIAMQGRGGRLYRISPAGGATKT